MKRTIFPFVLALVASQVAVAQTIFVPSQDGQSDTPTQAVYQSGDLIKVEAAVEPQTTLPTSEIHFFQGFASESSEEVLLANVEKAVAKDPDHACEIVKEAIKISKADVHLVAKIVETASLASPENMRLIAQCAMAANRDALEHIQQVLAKLDPATGDGDSSSGKELVSSKSGKETLVKTPAPPAPLTIRIDTPPPMIPFIPSVTAKPATNNDLR